MTEAANIKRLGETDSEALEGTEVGDAKEGIEDSVSEVMERNNFDNICKFFEKAKINFDSNGYIKTIIFGGEKIDVEKDGIYFKEINRRVYSIKKGKKENELGYTLEYNNGEKASIIYIEGGKYYYLETSNGDLEFNKATKK